MPLQLLKPAEAPQNAQPDLRSRPVELPVAAKADPDIVARLRAMDNRTPFPKAIVLEAAAEIEKLRAAIRKHREEVWGADIPDHASDSDLYRSLG
jgi:hypothetical protein